jgi:MoaA/NifB/PqqE/SkfB family radical SAM enzyme
MEDSNPSQLKVAYSGYIKKLFGSYLNSTVFAKRTPSMFSFLVTNVCQLRCRHCFYTKTLDNRSIKILTLDEYRKISESMGKFKVALICGGEPFTRPDLHEIIKLFYKNNKIKCAGTATNGFYQKSILSQVQKVLSYCKNISYSVWVSIDGFKDQHDYMRGAGVFERALSTFMELKKLKLDYPNLNVCIGSVMNFYNQKIMKDFIKFSADILKPDHFGLLLIRQNPKDPKSKEYGPKYYTEAAKCLEKLILSGKFSKKQIKKRILDMYASHLISETLATGKRQFSCKAGTKLGFIDCDGTVNLCEKFENENMGNLRDYDYDFKKLWFSPKNIEYKKKVNNDIICNACTHETEGLPSLGWPITSKIRAISYFIKNKKNGDL